MFPKHGERFCWRVAPCIALWSISIFAPGCGSDYPARVSGKVTLDGEPVAEALVTFHPLGSGAVAQGRTDASGRYELATGQSRGLAPGKYCVSVAAYEMPPGDGPASQVKMVTPSRYGNPATSNLRRAISAGNNACDFEL